MKKAAAQKGVGQFFFVVGSDDDDRSDACLNRLADLVDEEFHPVEFLQKIVRKLDIGLVDFVDQQHDFAVGVECVPKLAAFDIVADVLDLRVAQLRVAQAGDRVVLVKAVLCLGGRFDVPGDHRRVQRPGHFLGQHGFAGAGLALDEQRPLKRDRGVDRQHQIVGGNIGIGAGKAHRQWGGLLRNVAAIG